MTHEDFYPVAALLLIAVAALIRVPGGVVVLEWAALFGTGSVATAVWWKLISGRACPRKRNDR